MKKILIYTSFVIACFMVILAFVTATNYIQLGFAIILYPLIVYFAYEIFLKKSATLLAVSTGMTHSVPLYKVDINADIKNKPGKESAGVIDIDRRTFLKIIGATGISFLAYSLLGRRVENALFYPGLQQGTPGTTLPFEGYRISEIDDGFVTYHGFINKEGKWFVMKENGDGSFRYSKGETEFPNNWNNRKDLKFDYYHKLF